MNLRRFLDNVLGRDVVVAQPRLEARDPAITLISVIYQTQPKTFTGDAVYVTQTSVPSVQATDVSGDDSSAPAAAATSGKQQSATIAKPTTAVSSGGSSGSSASASAAAATSTTANTSTTAALNTATKAAASATSSPQTTAAPSSGMSGGAKAGLAFGLIILFALIGAGIFFILKKRKEKAEEEQLDDEKAFFANGRNPDALPAHATAGTSQSRLSSAGYYSEKPVPPQPAASSDADRARFSYEETAAPRLSLRGVSQFGSMSNLNDNGPLSAASSQALPAAGAAALAAAGGLGVGAMAARDRSNTVKNNDPNNPFGNHAEKLDSRAPNSPRPLSPGGRRSPGPQAADFPLPDSAPGSPNATKPSSPQPSKAQIAGGAAAGAAAIAAATAAAASNTPQGGPVADNVYRVQLDFKPSMDDELDINAGQLVRVLHEYDDGWALCIRMDRSKQGVVPRTCLSKHPVKPRPASPGGRPGPRGPPPPGMRGPPGYGPPGSGRNSPGPRGMSPAPYGSHSRPLTPTDGRNRSGSNAPYAQHPGMRSNSPGPNGGSRLRMQDEGRGRSNTNGSGLRNAQTPPSKIPGPVVSRKPVGAP